MTYKTVNRTELIKNIFGVAKVPVLTNELLDPPINQERKTVTMVMVTMVTIPPVLLHMLTPCYRKSNPLGRYFNTGCHSGASILHTCT